MRQNAILIFCVFILASCAKVETAVTEQTHRSLNKNENIQINSNKIVADSLTIQTVAPLQPVTPNVKLNSKQKKYLNESLLPKVREILERAESFEILAEVRESVDDDKDWMAFEPNRILKIIDKKDKKEILEVFYFDASREDSPAVCFYPRHLIRATYQGETIEIEICFSCSRFIVNSAFGKFDGTIVRENRKSEDFFSRIINSKSVELKQ